MDDEKTLIDAEEEVRQLEEQKAKIDRRLTGLHRIIEGLKYLRDTEFSPALNKTSRPYDYGGFTGFIKMLIWTSRVPLTPTDVRDFVKLSNIEGSDSENLLNHVHGVITRLRKQGAIKEIEGDANKPAYVRVSDSSNREMEPTPDDVESFRNQFNLAGFETRVAAVPPHYREVLRQFENTEGSQRPSNRATPPKSSLAAQSFAIEDAKKRSRK